MPLTLAEKIGPPMILNPNIFDTKKNQGLLQQTGCIIHVKTIFIKTSKVLLPKVRPNVLQLMTTGILSPLEILDHFFILIAHPGV